MSSDASGWTKLDTASIARVDLGKRMSSERSVKGEKAGLVQCSGEQRGLAND